MSLLEHIFNALRSIQANKLRAGLSSLGIIIGVMSVIVLLALGEGTQKSIVSSIESLWTNLLTLTPGSNQSSQGNVRDIATSNQSDIFTQTEVDILRNIPWIAAISPQVSVRKQLIYGAQNTNTTVYGVEPIYQSVRNAELAFGQFITEQDNKEQAKVAVVGSEIVKTLFAGQNPLWEEFRVGNTIFTIIGVMAEKGQSFGGNPDNAIFIPLTTAQHRVIGSSYISSISVSVADASLVTDVQNTIKNVFLRHFGEVNPDEAPFTITNQADLVSSISSITAVFKAFLGGVAAISLLVWGIGVMNIMLVSVTERTREIGIRKAVWARNRDIILQFLTESITLTVFGGVIGIILSMIIIQLLKGVIDAILTQDMIILASSFSMGIGIVFWILPAYKASRLKPIDALRFE